VIAPYLLAGFLGAGQTSPFRESLTCRSGWSGWTGAGRWQNISTRTNPPPVGVGDQIYNCSGKPCPRRVLFYFVTLTAVNAETVRGCCGVGSARLLENFRGERVEAIGCEPLGGGGEICGETLLSKLPKQNASTEGLCL
jgi:hypothetical protein